MKVAFTTLGCKVNQYETEILAQVFKESGYTVVSEKEGADVYVINSCTVTATGDKKTRQALHQKKRQNPNAIVALTGCYPQAFPSEASTLRADVITGTTNRKELVRLIKKYIETGEKVVEITPHRRTEPFEEMSANSFLERTRAFVKIEDGCDRYCAYCIIPTARGPVRSKAPEDLRQELATLARNGYSEVVLTGINLSSYGRELSLRLADAVEIAAETPLLKRIRLGSLEPELLTHEDLERLANIPQFCPQFHLSLQSGCDETLKRMRRHYSTKEYLQIVDDIRQVFPNPSITTDIMVGFPGETEEEFAQSLAFAKEVGFARAHIFAYSPRQGTIAAKMSDQCSPEVKKRRSSEMIAATDRTAIAFLQSQIGNTEEVLFETATAGGFEGYTKNYTPVLLPTSSPCAGKLLTVRLTRVENGRCIAEEI